MKLHRFPPGFPASIWSLFPFRRHSLSTVSLLPADVPSASVLPIRPWADGVIDALGHDPRSAYVERFWLGILGPSTTWLLRHMAARLDASPEGFDLDLAATAQALVWGFTVASGFPSRPGIR
jgi:hypothetical protein